MWKTVVEKYPSSPQAPMALERIVGLHYRARASRDSLIAEHQQLVARYPSSPEAIESRYRIGKLWIRRPPDFGRALAEVRNRYPDQGTAVSRGEIRLARYHLEVGKDPAKAAAILKDVIAKYPNSEHIVEAKYHLATCANAQGDRKSCIKQCKLIRAQYPDSPWCDYILYYIATCLYRDGQKQAATEALNDLIRLYPKSHWVPIARGTLSKIAPAGGQ